MCPNVSTATAHELHRNPTGTSRIDQCLSDLEKRYLTYTM